MENGDEAIMRVAAEECKRCALLALVSLSFRVALRQLKCKCVVLPGKRMASTSLCCGWSLQAANPGWAPRRPAVPPSPQPTPCSWGQNAIRPQASNQRSQLCLGLQPRHVLSDTTVFMFSTALGNWQTQWKHLKPSVPQNSYCNISTSFQSGFVSLHLTAIFVEEGDALTIS